MKLIYLHIATALLLLFTTSCSKSTDQPDSNNEPKVDLPFYYLYNVGDYNLQTVDSKRQVNMIFQVLDKNGKGVVNMNKVSAYKLIDYQNDMTTSAESNVTIDTFGSIPTEINSILLLDLSKSVEGFVPQIKQAALSFINASLQGQKFAIYTFDGETPKLRIDFTTNKTQLSAAINSLPETNLGTSTNIYEALITASIKLPAEVYSTQRIVQSNILLFTDGREEANPQNKDQALLAIADKNIFVAALQSNNLDESTLKELSSGNYFKAGNITELETKFKEIQNDISKLSRSVYWLYYTSPRRGNNTWNISLSIKENTNPDTYQAQAMGSYSSSKF
jgi:hypothetical protein